MDELGLFRFRKAFGGFAQDGDRYEFIVTYGDDQDLLELLRRLGISARTWR